MKRSPLYSSARSRESARTVALPASAAAVPVDRQMREHKASAFWPRFWIPRNRRLIVTVGLALAVGVIAAYLMTRTLSAGLMVAAVTQDDLDSAVMRSLQTQRLSASPAIAAERVRRSVVRIRGFATEGDASAALPGLGKASTKEITKPIDLARLSVLDALIQANPLMISGMAQTLAELLKQVNRDSTGEWDRELTREILRRDRAIASGSAPRDLRPLKPQIDGKVPADPGFSLKAGRQGSIGTGVVIVDTGVILTSFHVVAGAKRLLVTFSDGQESLADIVSVQPEKDLAVLSARVVPDDLPAATLGSTQGLAPGDQVIAVGFPFGLGPSVSTGVISGLNREFRPADNEPMLNGLIQFDAAVNPGSFGGPLITMTGEVVGIVTAILNPTEARTFIGIGFASTIESAGSAVGIPPF